MASVCDSACSLCEDAKEIKLEQSQACCSSSMGQDAIAGRVFIVLLLRQHV